MKLFFLIMVAANLAFCFECPWELWYLKLAFAYCSIYWAIRFENV